MLVGILIGVVIGALLVVGAGIWWLMQQFKNED